MAIPAEDLAALGRSLRQDLLLAVDVEAWQAPAITPADLSALARLELDQAIATFTADLSALADWLTEGLSLGGGAASGGLAGQGDGGMGEIGEMGERSQPRPSESAAAIAGLDSPDLGAATGLASSQVEAVPAHGGESSNFKFLETEPAADFLQSKPPESAAPQPQPSTPPGQLHPTGDRSLPKNRSGQAAPASPAELVSNSPDPQTLAVAGKTQGQPAKVTVGLAALAEQLVASRWPENVAPAEESIETRAIQAASPSGETRFRTGLAPAIAAPAPFKSSPSPQVLDDRGRPQPSLMPAEDTYPEPNPDLRNLMDETQTAGLLQQSRPNLARSLVPHLTGNQSLTPPPTWEVEPAALIPAQVGDQPQSLHSTPHQPSEELRQLAAPPRPPQEAMAPDRHPAPSPLEQSAPTAEPLAIAKASPLRSRDALGSSPLGALQPQISTTWANGSIDPDDPDFEDLMSAIAQTLSRDYHRFYGP